MKKPVVLKLTLCLTLHYHFAPREATRLEVDDDLRRKGGLTVGHVKMDSRQVRKLRRLGATILSVGAISAMGLPVTLSASAAAKVGSASVASHVATTGIANGDVISTTATQCGLDAGDVNGHDLVIAGTRASVKTDGGEMFVGTVTRSGSSFKATTELSGSTFSIIFTGSTERAGAIKGTYLYSGVPWGTRGGGEGESCTYAFTGALLAHSTGKCTLAALRAHIPKSQQHYVVGSFFKCFGPYAVLEHGPVDNNGQIYGVAPFVLHWNGTAWRQVLNELSICGPGDTSGAPIAFVHMACVS
jgi:hypothetical protein